MSNAIGDFNRVNKIRAKSKFIFNKWLKDKLRGFCKSMFPLQPVELLKTGFESLIFLPELFVSQD